MRVYVGRRRLWRRRPTKRQRNVPLWYHPAARKGISRLSTVSSSTTTVVPLGR